MDEQKQERGQFTFYASFARAISRIEDPEERCAAYDAIVNFALFGIEPDNLSPTAGVMFDMARPVLEKAARKAENGRNGGTAKSKTEAKRKQTESKRKQNESKSKQTEAKNILLSQVEKAEGEREREVEREKEIEIEIEIEREKEYLLSNTIGGTAQKQPTDEQTDTKPEPTKKEIEQKKEPLPFEDHPQLQAAFNRWLQYKTERKQSYKPQGLSALQKQIRAALEKYGEAAVIDQIQQSMASGWSGIFFDRLARQQKQDQPSYTRGKGAQPSPGDFKQPVDMQIGEMELRAMQRMKEREK